MITAGFVNGKELRVGDMVLGHQEGAADGKRPSTIWRIKRITDEDLPRERQRRVYVKLLWAEKTSVWPPNDESSVVIDDYSRYLIEKPALFASYHLEDPRG